jgi:serine/threonine-protein kinase
MDSKRWERIQDLFLEAREYTPQKRESFLRNACGDDEELYREVISLLESDRAEHSPLDRSPLNSIDIEKILTHTGQRAGAYRIVKEIGRGGMGSVYLAHREDGQFSQKVALKVINPGMDSKEILKRFKIERQITARLQHPNIARLLDGGITQNGLPFFTMEYVDGIPIDEYCREKQLELRERLGLFIEVCRAVQYAHQNLVIHRDLKPSNILVEKDGSVKLLDFGIAKFISPDNNMMQTANLTRTGMRVMSPGYASPEQIMNRPITISSDIYSLGVVLYELLTGHLPYDIAELNLTEIEKLVWETNPKKPSSKIETGHFANKSPNYSKRIGRRLRGDLDVICIKALHKEPERRYHSAEQFAEDIRRHLTGIPILARKDTIGYITAKFIKRNRGKLIAAAAVFILIAFLTGFYTVRLTAERNLARNEAVVSLQVTEFLMSLFEVSNPGQSRGETITARELLERGSSRIEAELSGQPEVQARLMHVLGEVYYTLGMYDYSKELTQKALDFGLESMASDDPRIAKYMSTLSWLLDLDSEYDSAQILARKALEINRKHFDEGSLEIANNYHNLAMILRHKGEFDAADTLYRKALSIKRAIPGIDPAETAHTLNHLARLLYQTGDYEGAIPIYKEALKIREDALEWDHPETMASMAGLAATHTHLDELDEAELLYRKSLESVEKTSGTEHPYYCELQNSLANVLKEKGDFIEAEKYFRESLNNHRLAFSKEHWKVSNPLLGLGVLLTEIGKYSEALEYLEEALKLRMDAFGEDHWRTGLANLSLGECFAKLGRFKEAEHAFLESYKSLQNSFNAANSYVVRSLDSIIELYTTLGNDEKARQYLALKTSS